VCLDPKPIENDDLSIFSQNQYSIQRPPVSCHEIKTLHIFSVGPVMYGRFHFDEFLSEIDVAVHSF